MLNFVIPKAFRDENPAGNFTKHVSLKLKWCCLKITLEHILAFISPERKKEGRKKTLNLVQCPSANRNTQVYNKKFKSFSNKNDEKKAAKRPKPNESTPKFLFASEKHIKIKSKNAFFAAIKESII